MPFAQIKDVHPKKGADFAEGVMGIASPVGQRLRGCGIVPKIDAPCMEYLPTFTINLSQLLVNIFFSRTMDPLGKIDAQTCSLAMDLFKGLSCFGMQSFDG